MKITKAQLSKLIKEELDQELKEQKQETPDKQKKPMGDVLALEKVLDRIDQNSEFGGAIERMLEAIMRIAGDMPGLKERLRRALIATAKKVVSEK